jgi:hypothetical protein
MEDLFNELRAAAERLSAPEPLKLEDIIERYEQGHVATLQKLWKAFQADLRLDGHHLFEHPLDPRIIQLYFEWRAGTSRGVIDTKINRNTLAREWRCITRIQNRLFNHTYSKKEEKAMLKVS